MRKLTFPVRSLGSATPADPDVSALCEWIHSRIGKETDLTTWNIEMTLKAQLPFVEFPTAGGNYYASRIMDSFNTICDGKVTGDFELNAQAILSDVTLANSIKKHCWWSIPSPSSLKIEDAYFGDAEEYKVALSEAIRKLCREMRDADIVGHVFVSEKVDEIELEYFSGKHYLWVVPDTELETVLEVQRDIVITTEGVSHLSDLLNSYDIRNVYVRDADVESLTTVLRYFDPEYINICGVAPEKEQNTYWKELAGISIIKSE